MVLIKSETHTGRHMIDWYASKEAWVGEVESSLLPVLGSDARLVGGDRLIARFTDAVSSWRGNGHFRPAIEYANELAAAAAILGKIELGATVHYESRLLGTKKSFDFMLIFPDGKCAYIDVKTIAPAWVDDEAAWQKFLEGAKSIPGNTHLIVDRDFSGAAISGQFVKARFSFVARTAEIEKKATLLAPKEKGPVWLLFCSEGAWRLDHLEDFADFYRTGQFRQDDWSQNIIARYMANEGIAFSRALAGFMYLERGHDEVFARRFVFNVHGPSFGR
jgi:hypothetical protein